MKTKEQLIDELYTPLIMKSKTISHIVLEGTDGVGKTTMLLNLLRHYNYRYIVYDRGELSNFVYAKKYNRAFISLQRNMPMLYVLLTCDKDILRKRIIKRGKDNGLTDTEILNDIIKIDDQDMFIQAANNFKNDYHIITVDISYLDELDACHKVAAEIDKYVNSLPTDTEETNWNIMYRKACNMFGLTLKVRDNQPYINDIMFMSESTWQNGAYETFTDKTCPDNLLYSLAYSLDCHKYDVSNKDLDFAYVINSKINRRHEIIDYYLEMAKNGMSCLVSNKVFDALNVDYFVSMPRAFGDEFIKQLSRAKATIYCARDLEYLKLQTARLYEGIIANQIVFVDMESDKNCDMLKQIHKDKMLIDLLYVTPQTFIRNYTTILDNPILYQRILDNQKQWYKTLVKDVFNYDI